MKIAYIDQDFEVAYLAVVKTPKQQLKFDVTLGIDNKRLKFESVNQQTNKRAVAIYDKQKNFTTFGVQGEAAWRSVNGLFLNGFATDYDVLPNLGFNYLDIFVFKNVRPITNGSYGDTKFADYKVPKGLYCDLIDFQSGDSKSPYQEYCAVTVDPKGLVRECRYTPFGVPMILWKMETPVAVGPVTVPKVILHEKFEIAKVLDPGGETPAGIRKPKVQTVKTLDVKFILNKS